MFEYQFAILITSKAIIQFRYTIFIILLFIEFFISIFDRSLKHQKIPTYYQMEITFAYSLEKLSV